MLSSSDQFKSGLACLDYDLFESIEKSIDSLTASTIVPLLGSVASEFVNAGGILGCILSVELSSSISDQEFIGDVFFILRGSNGKTLQFFPYQTNTDQMQVCSLLSF